MFINQYVLIINYNIQTSPKHKYQDITLHVPAI